MNCQGCGRFMKLEFAAEVGKDAGDSAFWWVCNNNDDCWEHDYGQPIAAPEYDWLYWGEGIPQEDLEADPELKADYDRMLTIYQNRNRPPKRAGG